MKKAFLYGILSSAFFAVTFLLNRSMNLSGGYWVWGASLRYFFSLPILFVIVVLRGNWKRVVSDIQKQPMQWVLWSTVGFGVFYAPLTVASEFGESWLIASLWQLTIVAGVFLNSLWGKKIPIKSLGTIFIILIGVVLMQWENMKSGVNKEEIIVCFLFVLIAAIAYPLGNRKMMDVCEEGLETPERVLGMTICSVPFWILLSIYGGITHGAPTTNQSLQSFVVAIFSAVIATLLFFQATNMVKHSPKQLSMVEGTIAGEVLFTLIGGIFLLHDNLPTTIQVIGIVFIVVGMILNCQVAAKEN